MIWVLIGAAVAIPAAFQIVGPQVAPRNAETSTPTAPTPEAVEAARQAIQAEPTVQDFVYQPGQAVEWQIGVLDDGSSRVGYANYICELLAEHKALTPQTQVRIVDIAKVSRGESFRSASLGRIACSDRRVIMP